MLDRYICFFDNVGVEGIDVDGSGNGIGCLVKEGPW